MNIILLSGGSGKRLWPLSNATRSKQFLKLLKTQDGELESMVQRVYGQINRAGINTNIVIATGKSQVESIRSQLGDNVDIVLEPERRDTFPAIALSCAYLALEKNVGPEEAVIVLPVDPYTDLEYFKVMVSMEEAVKNEAADIVLMGIQPTYPSSKYGYIVPAKIPGGTIQPDIANVYPIYQVEHFTEKPSEEIAERLILDGAVWNGGVFAFKLGYLMNIVKQHLEAAGCNIASYQELVKNYNYLKKISFDYEIVEKTSSVAMIPHKGNWKDLGTWNTLTEEMEEACIGRVMVGEDSVNTNVINELSIPVVVLGVKDLIVATSPDGILVADKQKSSNLKSYVEKLNDRPMYEESSWGEYKALDYIQYEDGIKSLTKHLTVKAGQNINYSAHYNRDEIWTVVYGTGEFVLDGNIKKLKRGDIIYITKGQRHAIKADTDCELHLIEVQIGADLIENDYEEFEWKWL